MKNKMKMVMPLLFVLSLFLSFSSKISAVGPEDLEKAETKITGFQVETASGNNSSNSIGCTSIMRVNIAWDASNYGNTLKEGDYFIVNLPKELWFPKGSNAFPFELNDEAGKNVIAHAEFIKKSDSISQATDQIKVVFTNYVNNRYNIKGSMFLTAQFRKDMVTAPSDPTLEISIGSNRAEKVVNVIPSITNPVINEVFNKWSMKTVNYQGHARWGMRINHKATELNNVILEDTLTAESGHLSGVAYIPSSFVLQEVTYTDKGFFTEISNKKIGDMIKFNEDRTSFTYELGDIGHSQYRLTYLSTYIPGLKLVNKAALVTPEGRRSDKAVFFDVGAGGQGSGNLTGKIKVVKVDENDQPIKLAGAVFEVKRLATGTSFTLETNNQGEAVSATLIPGDYEIVELIPPTGYVKSYEKYKVTVKEDAPSEIRIANKPEEPAPEPEPEKPSPEPEPEEPTPEPEPEGPTPEPEPEPEEPMPEPEPEEPTPEPEPEEPSPEPEPEGPTPEPEPEEPMPEPEPEEPTPDPEPEEPTPEPEEPSPEQEPEQPTPEPEPERPTPGPEEPTPEPMPTPENEEQILKPRLKRENNEKLPQTGEINTKSLTMVGLSFIILGISLLYSNKKKLF